MIRDNQKRPARSRMRTAADVVSSALPGHPPPAHHGGGPEDIDDFQAMAALWDDMDGLKGSASYADLLGAPTMRERVVAAARRIAGWRPTSIPLPWRLALPTIPVAAAIAGYVLIPQPDRYRAGDRPEQVTLADSSSVVLGPSSSVSFRIADGRRLATLQGQAEFSVAHDRDHPFRVDVGDAQVTVVGTRFKLANRNGCTQLSVSSGTVLIQSPGIATRRLNAGEESVAVDAGQFQRCLDGASDRGLRWSYVDVPLATVVNDIQPFYASRIRIDAADLARERVTLSFGGSEVRNIVEMIPDITRSHIARGTDGTIVIAAGKR